mgnify:CR=1 FL=1
MTPAVIQKPVPAGSRSQSAPAAFFGGGSGAYSGARGWAESIHYADGTWDHRLHLQG